MNNEQIKQKLADVWEEIKTNCRYEFEFTEFSDNLFIKPLTLLDVADGRILIAYDGKNDVGKDVLERKVGTPLGAIIPLYLDEEDADVTLEFFSPKEAEEYRQRGRAEAQPAQSKAALTPMQTNLNPKYTFDNFVVGNNNSMARAAALAVAEAPGEFYNPLYIYGGVGLGKTHLMHAIAHYALEHHAMRQAKKPENERVPFNVMYVTSEVFTNELIEALRGGKSDTATAEFRAKYRNVDMLLIDDIQFIIGKERTQEEFFHTFNSLYGNNRQLIISSDKPPKDFSMIEERLLSRFEMGLTVDIQAPDYETRMAILRNKADDVQLHLDDDIFDYIATNIRSNIRELEGALNKINVYARLKHLDITPELAKEALKDLVSPNSGGVAITPELIIKIVTDYYAVTMDDLFSSKKSRDITIPRQVTMYLLRQYTDMTLDEIGDYMRRDHSTVISGIRKIEKMIGADPSTANTIDALGKRISPD